MAQPTLFTSRLRLVAAGLIPLALCACGPVADAGGGGATSLLVGFQLSQDYRFKFAESIQGEVIGNGKDVTETITLNGLMDLTVVGVKPNGDLVVQYQLQQAAGSENHRAFKVPEVGKRFQLVIARDGQIKQGDEISAQSTNTLASDELPGGDQWSPLTPGGKKVAPGDSWQTSYTRPFSNGSGSITENDTTQFLRWDRLHGVKTAVVQTAYDIPSLDVSLSFGRIVSQCGCEQLSGLDPRIVFGGSLQGDETDWLDTAHDQILKSDSTGFFDLTFGLRDFPPGAEPNGDFRFSGSDHLLVEAVAIAPPGGPVV